jgi:hypothetical protein
MNKRQQRMIREAYEAGYRDALNEGPFKTISSLGKAGGKLIRSKVDDLLKLFRGSDIVSTNSINDLLKAVQETIPIGGDPKKLYRQLITIHNNDPNALKGGQIVVIKTKGQPVAGDVYGGITKIVQQPENPNILIGNIAIDVVDTDLSQIRRYTTPLGDATITVRDLNGDILFLPNSNIDGIIVVDPIKFDQLYPEVANRITTRTRDILRRGSGSGGVGSG